MLYAIAMGQIIMESRRVLFEITEALGPSTKPTTENVSNVCRFTKMAKRPKRNLQKR